jgi:cob(I)alamin adenosyltransferase
MRITTVYTGVGDHGTTRLVGGSEVSKSAPRVEATGTVDELNALVGLCRIAVANHLSQPALGTLESMLATVSNDLFNVGADLSTPAADRWPTLHRVGPEEVVRLEGWIDALNGELAPLEEFILPGGGVAGAQLHMARTVCRRAERRVVALIEAESDVGLGCMRYLNRLSDWCFVAARWAAMAAGVPETTWVKASTSPQRRGA